MSDLVERLRRIAGEMERHLGPPEMAPGPDPDDLTDAAAEIERLRGELANVRDVLWKVRIGRGRSYETAALRRYESEDVDALIGELARRAADAVTKRRA